MDIVTLFTTDVVLEIFRFLVVAALLGFLFRLGRRRKLSRVAGWRFVLIGFGLLTFGSGIDITDNFDELSKTVILGPNPVESVLEKIVGYTGGYVFCALGLFRWLTVYTAEHAELTRLRGRLEGEVAARTRELLAKAEELTTMNQDLRELASYRSSVVARVVPTSSRTPMTSVIGFAASSAATWTRPAPRLRPRAGPRGQASSASRPTSTSSPRNPSGCWVMVEDILDMAALERACLTWRDRQVDVGQAVDRAMASVYATFAEKPALSLGREIEPGLPHLSLDPDRLHQVLVNLWATPPSTARPGR